MRLIVTLFGLSSSSLRRDSWRRAGHGVWHFHQDSPEVPPTFCAGSSGRGDALHRWDSEQHQHHHLWLAASAGEPCLLSGLSHKVQLWNNFKFWIINVCHTFRGSKLCFARELLSLLFSKPTCWQRSVRLKPGLIFVYRSIHFMRQWATWLVLRQIRLFKSFW